MENDELSPGANAVVEMTLLYPERFGSALHEGNQFEIWEGLRKVGWGVIQSLRRPA
jgi:hypothetical protein